MKWVHHHRSSSFSDVSHNFQKSMWKTPPNPNHRPQNWGKIICSLCLHAWFLIVGLTMWPQPDSASAHNMFVLASFFSVQCSMHHEKQKFSAEFATYLLLGAVDGNWGVGGAGKIEGWRCKQVLRTLFPLKFRAYTDTPSNTDILAAHAQQELFLLFKKWWFKNKIPLGSSQWNEFR